MMTDEGEIVEALALVPPTAGALAVSRAPETVLEEARKAAAALKDVIDSKKKKVTFHGETYLENEDWLTVARFYGVTSRIRDSKYLTFENGSEAKVHGYEATAEAYLVSTGQVLSMADSMCLSDEGNWSQKPLFQLRSMAQTRASSRVLRQVFGWVVVLAGYKPTPAEEMDTVAHENGASGIKEPQRKAEADVPSSVISEKQMGRMFSIGKQAGKSNDDIKAIYKGMGFEHAEDITKDKYNAVVEAVGFTPIPTAKPKIPGGDELSGKCEKAEQREKNGKYMVLTMAGGLVIFFRQEPLFVELKQAVGKFCRFKVGALPKPQQYKGLSVLQIGEKEWMADGVPVIQRGTPQGEPGEADELFEPADAS